MCTIYVPYTIRIHNKINVDNAKITVVLYTVYNHNGKNKIYVIKDPETCHAGGLRERSDRLGSTPISPGARLWGGLYVPDIPDSVDILMFVSDSEDTSILMGRFSKVSYFSGL